MLSWLIACLSSMSEVAASQSVLETLPAAAIEAPPRAIPHGRPRRLFGGHYPVPVGERQSFSRCGEPQHGATGPRGFRVAFGVEEQAASDARCRVVCLMHKHT